MVGRIEWGRYEGDDVEAVVAMMINREHPNSERINPSRGDGGIDILDRGAGDDGGDVIYQVKRHASSLNSSQKEKVIKSAERILDRDSRDPRWADLNITVWRLVTPWDPTPEAETWLQNKVSPYGVRVVWDGLTRTDQLAARYSDVIDYYLHGGRSEIVEAQREAMALMSLGGNEKNGLTVPEVSHRINQALKILDHDPHYYYETHYGRGELPDPTTRPARPGLVMTSFRSNLKDSTWQAIDIIARCAASLKERPITVNGTFNVEGNTKFASDIKEFFEFGVPFSSPDGSFSGTVDAPGGLGGELREATIRTAPVEGGDLGLDPKLHVEVLNPEGDTIAEADVDRAERSAGSSGIRSVLSEIHGIFDMTFKVDNKTQTTQLNIDNLRIESLEVSTVSSAVDFLQAFQYPNSFRISVRNTPSRFGSVQKIPERPTGHQEVNLEPVMTCVHLLQQIQQNTSTLVLIPDLGKFAEAQWGGWKAATEILNGKTVAATLDEGQAFHFVLDSDVENPTDSFVIQVPLKVSVGDQVIDLGAVNAEFENAELVFESSVVNGQKTVAYTTADKSVRYLRDSN